MQDPGVRDIAAKHLSRHLIIAPDQHKHPEKQQREDTGMTGSMGLLDELRERGFTPCEDGEPWFDLTLGPRRMDCMVRVEIDDTDVIVHALSGNGVSFWQVTMSDGTPLNVVTTVIDLTIAEAATRFYSPSS